MPESSAHNANDIARASSAAMHASDRASQALGMQVVGIEPGAARVTMTVRGDMLNGHADCHGGFVFMLADSAFAHACNSYGRLALASAASIEFLKTAGEGDVLTAVARERQRARRSGIYDVEVRDAEGALVALFRGRSIATDAPVASVL